VNIETRAAAVVAAVIVTLAVTGCGGSSSPYRGNLPGGGSGVPVASIQGVPVAASGNSRLTVRCSAACRGTLTLTADIGMGKPERVRAVAITPPAPFTVRAASGGTVAVSLRVDSRGLVALRAAHNDLSACAVMRYAAASGRAAQTDRYQIKLR